MTYINWRVGTDNGRQIWEAFSGCTDETYLGYLHLKNWGQHIHWTWTQRPDIDMSPGCLDEVRQKMKELHKKRKLDFSELHDCEKCRGKMVVISVDPTGIERCGYCNEIVNYKEWFMKNPKMKGELEKCMKTLKK